MKAGFSYVAVAPVSPHAYPLYSESCDIIAGCSRILAAFCVCVCVCVYTNIQHASIDALLAPSIYIYIYKHTYVCVCVCVCVYVCVCIVFRVYIYSILVLMRCTLEAGAVFWWTIGCSRGV